jgi:hypothetical protein
MLAQSQVRGMLMHTLVQATGGAAHIPMVSNLNQVDAGLLLQL